MKKRLFQPLSRLLYHIAPNLWRRLRRFREEGVFAPSEIADRGGAPQLFVDVSMTAHHDAGTGIQRVVRSLAGALCRVRPEAASCVSLCHGSLVPVMFEDGVWQTERKSISLKKGDSLFFLDFSAYREVSAFQAANRIHAAGGLVVGMIYDWLPAEHPEWFASGAFVDTFLRWQTMLLSCCDAICCDSRAAADATERHFRRLSVKRERPLRLYPIPMGAELRGRSSAEPREEIARFVAGGRTVLMVGTMEPRKGHDVALSAFARLWEKGQQDVRLLIIGQCGWGTAAVAERIEAVRREGRPLFWVRDADDEELSWCYAHAALLLAASRDEGFGLPIIEAAQHGCPLLLSDIPVFHEVAGSHADYFSVGDSEALARALFGWLAAGSHPDSRRIRLHTWEEAARVVWDVFDGHAEPYKILQ